MADYGHELEFGTFLTPDASNPQQVVALAGLTEQAGLDLVTFQDHPYQPSFLDTWTLMSYVAARTERVQISANVLNLPLRPPAVLARAAASLDLLSGGRAALGIGAGAFWDAIEAMGGPRRSPGESIEALEEAIGIIREAWDTEQRGGVRVDGKHYRVAGAKRGPAPAHRIPIWIGAYKPRILRLVGRLGDGVLPSLAYLDTPEALGPMHAIIDEAAVGAGRDPHDIRRLLNVGPNNTDPDFLAGLALDHGVSTFVLGSDDPSLIQAFGLEIAPAVRELVATARSSTAPPAPTALTEPADSRVRVPVPAPGGPEGLDVRPTPDPGIRLASTSPWDETQRPTAPAGTTDQEYTDRGRAVSRHLIDVHDALRSELQQVRDLADQVRQGTLDIGAARSTINEMTMRQNNWTLGAYCESYCRIVTQHHTLEDQGIFTHLRSRDDSLAPVIDRLEEEHLAIHDVLEGVDRALVDLVADPGSFAAVDEAVDLLTDTLLSHFAYEERELVGPLARYGMFAGQL